MPLGNKFRTEKEPEVKTVVMTNFKNTDDIGTALVEWKSDLTRVMSSDVDPEKFIAAVTTALTLNPDIGFKCTPDSIKNACIKAAYDGLRPDGKEGALVAYFNKDAKAHEASWMPMVYGIRKKARKHDDIIISAEVVYKNDKFLVIKGDDERIEHEPAPMDADPGQVIASYAIFKQGDTVLHREVMRLKDIEDARNASKSPNSPAWRNWFGEMAKKVAVNRGSKSVPMSDAVMQTIQRDNDFYDFNNARDVTPATPTLANRFGGSKSEGFNADNLKQIDGGSSLPMDRIDNHTGEIIEAKTTDRQTSTRATERQSTNSSSRTSSSQADDEKSSGGANTSSQRAPAGDFTEFAMALLRFGGTGNGRDADIKKITAATDQFWQSKNGRPDHPADVALSKAIIGTHLKRMANEIDAEATKAETAKLVDQSFNGL